MGKTLDIFHHQTTLYSKNAFWPTRRSWKITKQFEYSEVNWISCVSWGFFLESSRRPLHSYEETRYVTLKSSTGKSCNLKSTFFFLGPKLQAVNCNDTALISSVVEVTIVLIPRNAFLHYQYRIVHNTQVANHAKKNSL